MACRVDDDNGGSRYDVGDQFGGSQRAAMRTSKLKADPIALLREVLENRARGFLDDLVAKAEAGTLVRSERLHLCELIGAEFAESGVGSDSEPSSRGERLEQLLDIINRPNIEAEP